MTEVELWTGDKWTDTGISPDEVRKDKGLEGSLENDGYWYYHSIKCLCPGQLVYRIKGDTL